MIPLMTTGKHPLHLDRKMVAKVDGVWYWNDKMIWRRMDYIPEIDIDFTQRWFGYSVNTVVKGMV